jgi:hypothetical protein
MTASAIFGLSKGAKAMNQEWSRWRSATFFSSYFSFCFMAMTCAVPVLPPLVYWAPANERAPVPSLFTPAIARLTNSMWSERAGTRWTISGSKWRRSPVRGLSM